ncbi:Uma2 family endonuclease [Ornithinibacter sp.]|jgi:Uma2 family endonuclease|uniref:Uma2 family endonuclease n=1 Tax=Ornithinibacter sp. TaxID=2862748 RepID=UPI001B50D82B|nr:Uma2 family endonuclease [Ornithinibacter sp.]MBP6525520.1 Uma2 family endonuclease [Dermatophilaceae bacterium]HPZ51197.1 Uma2 family endonuclease [Propionibacteriaceae bacterium]
MDAMTFVLDDRVWTREERDSLPPDGSRHELLDGALVVTPSPGVPHQRMVMRLAQLLLANCPAELEVFFAPLDVTLAADTVLEPDLLVVRRSQATGATLDGVPLLAIEVASPSTRMVDRNLKLPRFERAGCPSFWIVDPLQPSLTAWDLREGHYVEVAHVVGEQSWSATLPFPVTIRPAELIA